MRCKCNFFNLVEKRKKRICVEKEWQQQAQLRTSVVSFCAMHMHCLLHRRLFEHISTRWWNLDERWVLCFLDGRNQFCELIECCGAQLPSMLNEFCAHSHCHSTTLEEGIRGAMSFHSSVASDCTVLFVILFVMANLPFLLSTLQELTEPAIHTLVCLKFFVVTSLTNLIETEMQIKDAPQSVHWVWWQFRSQPEIVLMARNREEDSHSFGKNAEMVRRFLALLHNDAHKSPMKKWNKVSSKCFKLSGSCLNSNSKELISLPEKKLKNALAWTTLEHESLVCKDVLCQGRH